MIRGRAFQDPRMEWLSFVLLLQCCLFALSIYVLIRTHNRFWASKDLSPISSISFALATFYEIDVSFQKINLNPLLSLVAERVVQKENLVLDEAKLTTTLVRDPKNLPTDKRSVHVSGISDRTTKDGLMTYMEVISGEEVENVLFGDTCNAMVIFKDPPGTNMN